MKNFSLHVPLLFMALLMMMILSCGAGNQKSAVPCSQIKKINSTNAEHLNVGTIACLQGIHINLTRYMTTSCKLNSTTENIVTITDNELCFRVSAPGRLDLNCTVYCDNLPEWDTFQFNFTWTARTTCYEAAYEGYQQLQYYKSKKKTLKRLRSRDMA